MCTSKIERERERERERVHSGSMSCQANHLRGSAPFSFEAWRTSSSFGESEGSSSGSGFRGRSGGWGKRLSNKLGVRRCGGAVLGAVRRVPCASIDRRLLIVWMDDRDCVVLFCSASTFVREPLLFFLFFWLIWKVKGNCCSTSNCTGDVMLSCQQGVDFKIPFSIPFSINSTMRKLWLYFDRSTVYTLMVLLDLICISFLGLCSSCKECFDMFGLLFLTYYVLE